MGSSGMFAHGLGSFGGALVIASVAIGCSNAREGVPSGVPPGPKGVALASGQDHPISIAVEGTNIYWTNRGTSPAFDDGSIVKMPIDGGEPIVLASGLCDPSDIAVDDSSVYWTGVDCSANVVVVLKMPVDGGPVVTLASECGMGMALGGGFVFCITSGTRSVMKVPVEGGLLIPVSTPDETMQLSLTADTANVYWTRALGSSSGLLDTQLVKAPLQGGSPTVLVTDFHQAGDLLSRIPPISSDGSDVFWIDAGWDRVKKVPVNGGAPVLVADGQGRVVTVASQGGHVSWSTCNGRWGTPPNDRSMVQVPTTGAVPEVLAKLDDCAADMAIDAQNVYWIEEDMGTVFVVSYE